jgi:hypothetical protein
MASDLGIPRLSKIERGEDFWRLMDELADDKSGFVHNKTILVDAFRQGKLFGLRVEETDAMFKRQAWKDTVFCKGSYYLLPCLCIRHGVRGSYIATIIWTHSRARRKGFARTLVKLLKIKEADTPLPESTDFWDAMGIYPKIS